MNFLNGCSILTPQSANSVPPVINQKKMQKYHTKTLVPQANAAKKTFWHRNNMTPRQIGGDFIIYKVSPG
jgi:hypothetical protein